MKFLITIFIGVFGSLWAGATEDTQNQWITCFKDEYSFECSEWMRFNNTTCTRPAECKEINLKYVMFINETPSRGHTSFYFPARAYKGTMVVHCKNSQIKKGRHCPISEELQLR